MTSRWLKSITFSVSVLWLAGCAGGLQIADTSAPRSQRTVVLFLVDGLGAKILQSGIASGRMPNMKKFFLRGQSGFALGQAAFPSLTYPNISSVLTARGIGEQPVNANKMVIHGKVMNYESAFHHGDLERAVDPQTIFARLSAEGRSSASFSYVFGQNATDHMAAGLREGLEYHDHDYDKLDARLIENLEEYLSDRADPRQWPDFIYVHLVGVDGTAHRFGPGSAEVKNYLSWLDEELEPIFSQLQKAEKRKSVVTMLTADHGFVETKRFVDLEKYIKETSKDLLVTNESRFLGIYLPKGQSQDSLQSLLTNLRSQPGVEMTVSRRDNSLDFATAWQNIAFQYGPAACGTTYSLAPATNGVMPAADQYRCPQDLNSAMPPYPFLVESVSRYFNSANRPDAIVIAKPDTAFTNDHLGNHGGPTADEMLVPVLLRGASMHGTQILHTSHLLKALEGV